MYPRGITVREMQGFPAQQCGTAVSPAFSSSGTDEVLDEITAWQQRPLDRMSPVLFFDALGVKIHDDGNVQNTAVYVALGVHPEGTRAVLGLWIEKTEGAPSWLTVFNDLRTRGVHDVLIVVVDGLAVAIETALPPTTVQTCLVHLVRNRLVYESWKDRQALVAALRPGYTAVSVEAAALALEAFAAGPWGQKHPTIVQSWQRAWPRVIPFARCIPAVRRVIYTTNTIEGVRMRLRKIIKTRGHFPSDEAAPTLLLLVLQNAFANTARSVREWQAAMHHIAILLRRSLHPAQGLTP
jgi:putative transposase